MTKLLDATCEAGVVTIEGQVVEAEILSQGTKSSEGSALIDRDKVVYLTSNADDIKKLIEDVTALVQQLTLIVTGLDGVTVPPGTQAANIVLLTTLKTQFELTKENLK